LRNLLPILLLLFVLVGQTLSFQDPNLLRDKLDSFEVPRVRVERYVPRNLMLDKRIMATYVVSPEALTVIKNKTVVLNGTVCLNNTLFDNCTILVHNATIFTSGLIILNKTRVTLIEGQMIIQGDSSSKINLNNVLLVSENKNYSILSSFKKYAVLIMDIDSVIIRSSFLNVSIEFRFVNNIYAFQTISRDILVTLGKTNRNYTIEIFNTTIVSVMSIFDDLPMRKSNVSLMVANSTGRTISVCLESLIDTLVTVSIENSVFDDVFIGFHPFGHAMIRILNNYFDYLSLSVDMINREGPDIANILLVANNIANEASFDLSHNFNFSFIGNIVGVTEIFCLVTSSPTIIVNGNIFLREFLFAYSYLEYPAEGTFTVNISRNIFYSMLNLMTYAFIISDDIEKNYDLSRYYNLFIYDNFFYTNNTPLYSKAKAVMIIESPIGFFLVYNNTFINKRRITDSAIIVSEFALISNGSQLHIFWNSIMNFTEPFIVEIPNRIRIAGIAVKVLRIYLNTIIASRVSLEDAGFEYDWGGYGNYWSCYNVTDKNHDGIGDAPIWFDDDSVDRHPLVKPHWYYNITCPIYESKEIPNLTIVVTLSVFGVLSLGIFVVIRRRFLHSQRSK